MDIGINKIVADSTVLGLILEENTLSMMLVLTYHSLLIFGYFAARKIVLDF